MLLAAILICSCSVEEDAEQESGVKYYTAKNICNTITASEIDEQVITTIDIAENLSRTNDANEETVDTSEGNNDLSDENGDDLVVYVTPSGKKYHYIKTCPGKNSTATTLSKAIASGKGPCKKCAK